MARGEKSSYSGKQRRQAEHIAEGYKQRGVSRKTASKRAWATVNKMTGGGKVSGSGRGKPVDKAPAKKGGALGGAASARRPATARSAAALKAARTRARTRARARARTQATTRTRARVRVRSRVRSRIRAQSR